MQGYIDTYTPVTSTTTSWTGDNGGYYVVNEDVKIDERITVSGEANLILCDGKTLIASQGIEVLTDNTLNIYGQSNDTGKIIATGTDDEACIGGKKDSHAGSINIKGGRIEANNHSGTASTGIGGGTNSGFNSIKIYGGTVVATGTNDAPAIGTGPFYDGTNGNITIYGGSVDATGGMGAAGIGGGLNVCGQTISIYGGEVNATGGDNSWGDNGGAGIGGGYHGNGGSVTISGGIVTATGGDGGGVGIGAGAGSGDHGTLTVIGLTVLGGDDSEPTTIQTDYATTRWQYMRVLNLHTHNFTYSASGNAITATCDNADGNCPLPNHQATLTISAPTGSLIYDGTAKEATYEDTSSGTAFSNITISYTKGGETIFGSPINAGNYTASVTYSGKTASIDFFISKASSSLESNPTGVSGLIYNGNDQVLITAGTASGGELKYSLDGTNYSSSIPTGTNAGTYNVYYKVFGDSNHNDSEEQSLIVSISKATVDPVGTIDSTYGKTLGDVILPSGWAWDDPTSTSVGNVGSNVFNATFAEQPNYNEAHQAVTINVATADPDPVGVLNATFGDTLADVTLPAGWAWDDPTSTSVGNVGNHSFNVTYTPIDGNHHAKNDSITVNVSQATPTGYDIPTGLNATYGDTLSSVKLPDTWVWKNPNDKVGNAGNREHIAIYTPTDPNYRAVENILTIAVSKANPSVPTLDTIEAPYDVALSTVALPEGFSWMDGTQKTSGWGENTFKVKYTPADQANYNIIENIDVKVNVKWILVDPTQGDVSVTINGDNEEYTVDISVKVEVKTEITVDQKRNEYASLATKDFVKPNEDISAIYGVKLIRTTNGVEEEIQPSDIKPGTKITVSMVIPEELVGKDFRLLHIHNSDDIVEVTNYAVSKDGKTLMLEVDRLSDFAFIIATDADNGFIYSIGLPGWAIALIIIGGILLLGILTLLILFIFFPVYYIDYSKHEVKRAIYLRTRHGEVLMLNTHFVKVRRNETDVYKKKSDALNALNK